MSTRQQSGFKIQTKSKRTGRNNDLKAKKLDFINRITYKKMVLFSVLKVNYFNTNRINHGKVKVHLIPKKALNEEGRKKKRDNELPLFLFETSHLDHPVLSLHSNPTKHTRKASVKGTPELPTSTPDVLNHKITHNHSVPDLIGIISGQARNRT